MLATVSLASPPCWFRFVCRLILTGEPISTRIAEVAEANQLMFLEVQRSLNEAVEWIHFDILMTNLVRDYHRVRNLLCAGATAEHRLLHVNFHLLQLHYRIVRKTGVSNGRWALEEMALVVRYFTNLLAVTIPS
jgi:hypothetical protein